MKVPFEIISVFDAPELGILGNPSAVVFLPHALETEQLQKIAADFNQPATTFLWKEAEKVHVRWMAPDAEIGLCGHGSLAAFAALKNQRELATTTQLVAKAALVSGGSVSEQRCFIELEALPVKESIAVPTEIEEGLGVEILEMFATDNKHIVVVKDENTVKSIQPNFSRLRDSEIFGYAVTARGNSHDFVSRTFVPHVGQLEDFATGSSHAALTHFWSQRLQKNTFTARQLSARGGEFNCSIENDIVRLEGCFTRWASGSLHI